MSKEVFLGLRTVIYRVDDLERAKAWYTAVLGHAPYFDEPFYIGFNVGGFELGLQPREEQVEGHGSGGVEAYWGVEDVNKSFERLISLGATEHAGPRNVGGPIEVATVKDPWGNILGLIFNPLFAAGDHEPPH